MSRTSTVAAKPFQNVLPRTEKETTVTQKRLIRAGYRQPQHVNIFYAAKVLVPLSLTTLAIVTKAYEALDGAHAAAELRLFLSIKLLELFIRHPGRVFTREQVLDHAWGDGGFVADRTIDVVSNAGEVEVELPPGLQTIVDAKLAVGAIQLSE